MKSSISFLIVIALLSLFIACKDDKEDNPTPPANTGIPSVSTQSISNITASGAETGGNITSDGGSSVTARGVCWSTASGPTTSGSKTSDGSGTGSFTSTVIGLSPNQTYFLRAYATNANGTAYGNEVQFSTSQGGGPCPGGASTVTDIDGNIYNVLTIANQCWTIENLKTSRYRNGDNISTGLSDTQWQNSTSGNYAIYANNVSNENIYGKLYNQYAVTDPRGLCPTGWHVATKVEFEALITEFGGGTVAGGELKSTGTVQAGTGLWDSPNTGATNSSGFTALPAGIRELFGPYTWINTSAIFWSSTTVPASNDGYYMVLDNTVASASIPNYNKALGASVRCVKD